MQGTGIWRALAALLLTLTISACGGMAVQQPRQQPGGTGKPQGPAVSAISSGPMRVAVLVPLTGEFAPIGQQLLNAAAVALFEDQQTPFELLPFDTRGTLDGAAQAAAAAQRQQVDLVIGPLFSAHAAPVRQVMAASTAAILTFTNDTSQAGGNVFVLGVSIESEIERLAEALAQSGKRRLLVLGPDNDYTRHTLAVVKAMAASGRLDLVRSGTFAEGADFNAIAEQVKLLSGYDRRRANWQAYQARLVPQVRQSANPSALLNQEAAKFPEGSIRRQMLAGMALTYNQHISRGRNQALSEVISRIEGVDATPADDFDVVLLPFGDQNLVAVGSMLDLYNAGLPFAQVAGTSLWQRENLAREPSFHSAWYTAMDRDTHQPFLLAYRASFQEEPDPIAVLGYYAARVAATAASEQVRPVTPAYVRRPDGFYGQGGIVRFGADNRMRSPLSVYQVTPQGVAPLPTVGTAPPTS